MTKPRAALYLLAFIAIMVAVIAFSDWQRADWWIYGQLPHGEPPRLHKDIVILDVPDDPDRERFRVALAASLVGLTRAPDAPKIVVLDFQIDREPRGLEALEQAVRELQRQRVAVYAAANPLREGQRKPNPEFLQDHAQALYSSILDGYGHTVFDLLYGSLKYDPYLDLGANGVALPALPIRIAEAHYELPPNFFKRPLMVHLIAPTAFDERVVQFHDGRFQRVGSAELAPAWRDKLVIVANLARDRPPEKPLSGPLLLASALNERIATNDAIQATEVWEGPFLLLATIATFSVLALIVFWAGYRFIPSTHSRLAQLAAVSAGAALLVLGGFNAILYSLGRVYPQLSLVVVAVISTSILAWLFARRYLFWADAQEIPLVVAEEYDVFISYSRTPENAAWVAANIYQPLAKARRANGTLLRIFFDTQEIGVGEKWFRKLRHAINASRFFVPVYSEDYFKKDFCVYEMERAARKQVRLNDEEFILPIARVTTGIPEDFNDVQFIDAEREPRFMDKLVQKILAASPVGANKARVDVAKTAP